MTQREEKKARLYRHFGNRKVTWVPFWGISKIRHRGGVFAGEVPGDLIDYDKWYSRMLSPQTFDRLAEMGFNLVILPFSLGGTLEHEAQEHEDFRQAAALCHERNITALPYLQFQNVLQESCEKEYSSWAQQPSGNKAAYFYYRRTLCQNSSEFKEYLNGVIAESSRCGADGIWIDNSYLKPCACPLCRKDFSEYLSENYPDLIKTLHLIPEKVEIPPLQIGPYTTDACGDPIARAFFEFNIRRDTELLKEFRSEMRKSNPDGLFASNPGIHRGSAVGPSHGVDLAALYELHDIIYLENRQITDWEEGVPLGNYRGVTEADAFGTVAVTGAWKHMVTTPGITTDMPGPEEIGPMVLEPLLFGGGASAFWLIREMPDEFCRCGEDKLKGYFEYPPMTSALKRILMAVKGVPSDSINAATTGVFLDRLSWMFDFEVFEESRYAVTEALTAGNIPWRSVSDFDDTDGLKLLILPHARIMSDETVEKFRKLAESGVKLLFVGSDCGLFNERRRRRTESPFALLAGTSRYAKEAESFSGNYHLLRDNGVRGERFPHLVGIPERMHRSGLLVSGLLVEKIRSLNPPEFTVDGGVTASLRRTAEGVEFMQLLDYRTPEESREVTIRFLRERAGVYRSLDGEEKPFNTKELTISGFRVYGMITFKKE